MNPATNSGVLHANPLHTIHTYLHFHDAVVLPSPFEFRHPAPPFLPPLAAPTAASAVSAHPGSFVGEISPVSASSAGGVASNGGIGGSSNSGGGCDPTPPRSSLRSRAKSATSGGGGGSGSGSGSGGGSGGRRRTDCAAGERGAVRDRCTDLPPPKRTSKEEDDEEDEEDDGDSSGSSDDDDDDEGFEGAAAVGVLGQGDEFGSEVTEGGGATPSPRSPLETSPRSSGEHGFLSFACIFLGFGSLLKKNDHEAVWGLLPAATAAGMYAVDAI